MFIQRENIGILLIVGVSTVGFQDYLFLLFENELKKDRGRDSRCFSKMKFETYIRKMKGN